jgi:hypothetical protein
MPAPPAAPQGYPPAPPQNQSNGLAVAGLIFGILPTPVLGIIFGILGLVRSGKVGGKGKAMSWIGIILSVLWIAVSTTLVVVALGSVKSNPGCDSAIIAAGASVNYNSSDPAALQKQFKDVAAGLDSAAAESNDAAATTAIKKLADDYRAMADAMDTGNLDPALVDRITSDGQAVDQACGV